MKIAIMCGGLVVLLVLGVMMPGPGCARKDPVQGSAGKAVPAARFRCPMHPQIVSDKPGECPICGMALEPIAGTVPEVKDKAGIDGLAPVVLSPDLRQRMGLTMGRVEKRSMKRVLRLPARIEADETRQVRVTFKLEGFVETLFVSATGQSVKKGDPLLTLYSPPLVAAAEEFRIAGQSGMPSLIEAARRRLMAWDVTVDQMAGLTATNAASRVITLFAPAGGTVTEKTLLAGQRITSGEPLMVITDCTVVWALADVSESDVPLMRIGAAVELSFANLPEKIFRGEVSFLPPGLDPVTHTLRARIVVPNPELLLRLGMYAEARVLFPAGERVAIPAAAVMQTGSRNYAFRDDGEGRLSPVEISIGLKDEGYFEVLAGLAAGDRVVTSANFLLDSESSIRAANEGQEKQAAP